MSNLPKIAWIGLGIMGSPMSENLIKAGYDVTGFTLEQDKLDRLTAAGGKAAASIAPASPPETGASSTRMPLSAAALARSTEVCGVIEDMSISRAPDLAFSRMPSGP